MAEFRVRFVGDLGNLAAFNNAIRNSLSSNAATLERANSQVVSRSLGQSVRPASSPGSGLFVKNATAEIDRLNNSFIQSGTVVRRYVDGFTTQTKKVTDAITGLSYDKTFSKRVFGEAFHSDFKKAIGNVEAYERAIARLAPVEKQRIALEGSAARRISNIATTGAQVSAYADLKPSQQTDAQRQALFRSVNRLAPGILTNADDLIPVKGFEQGFQSTIARIQSNLHGQRITIQKSLQEELKALQNDPIVKKISQEAFYAATSPEGRLGRETTNVLNRYPAVRRDLEQKVGLGGGQPFVQPGTKTLNPQYAINAQNQGFEIANVYRDMERGLVRISGSAKGADDIMTQFSYTVDKNGNAVNSWGRNLSGARGFLNQTTRDLVKVVEWTVATTVVFGALGVAIASFSKINDLNVNLQRFAITARLSNDELKNMFEGLSKVAYSTATPIGELVKAADDMALATRRANQSGEEWKASILELANAVGILTNISGLDTVRATELLVASMKQLNLQTKDLVPLLSSITAAAGGQSGSITDIASALAVLAEAAETARIPLEGQIAAVQVISQVTGKSADQTANAFKNLFGAINSDTSIDKLAEFGIAVRDVNGELRPFLEIYRDIADKVKSGVIPQGRLNEVLRAISGGRTGRQADAAALLSNIYRVFEVQDIAAGASNEALIANAKILDTNQAKITRFQNAFDITIFEKFNQIIVDLTSTLADLGTVFANIFGSIPTEVISVIVQIIALTAAIKLLTKAGASMNLMGAFTGLRKNLYPAKQIVGLTEAGISASRPTGFAEAIKGTDSALMARLNLLPRYTPYADRLKAGTPTSPYFASTPYVAPTSPLPYARPVTIQYANPTWPTKIAPSTVNEQSPTFWPNPYQTFTRRPISRSPIPNELSGGFWPDRILTPAGSELTRNKIPSLRTPLEIKNIDIIRRMSDIGFPVKVDGETRSLLQRFIGVFGKTAGSRAGKVALGAAAGAGAALAGGDGLSGLATLAGSALLFTPAAPIGAGLLVGGAIIDHFNQQADEAAKKASDLQSTLYNLTLQWKQDSAAVAAAQKSYSIIENSLGKAAVGTEKYRDLQGQLGEATIEVALALDTQLNSTKQILDTVEELNKLSGVTGDTGLADFAKSVIGKNLSTLTPQQISELTGIVSTQILGAAGQTPYRPATLGLNTDTLNTNLVANNDPIRFSKINAFGFNEDVQYTGSQFATDTDALKRFLSQIGYSTAFGGQGRANFTAENFPFQNQTAIAGFEESAKALLATLPQAEREKFIDDVIQPFEEAVEKFATASTQVGQAITNTSAEVQAQQLLGILSGPKADNANANIRTAEGLQSLLSRPNVSLSGIGPGRETGLNPTGGVVLDEANETIKQLLANSLTGTFDPKLFKTAAEEGIKSLGLIDKLPEGIERTTAEAALLREQFGLTDEQIVLAIGSLGNLKTAASEALDAMISKTEELAQSQLSDVGQKLLTLQARRQGGEFVDEKGKTNLTEYNFLKAQYEAQVEGINSIVDASKQLENVLVTEEAVSNATEILSQKLTEAGVNGFQGLTGSIDNSTAAFFTWMNTLNLSGKAVDAAVQKWIALIRVVTLLAQVQTRMDALSSADLTAPIFRRNRSGEGYSTGTTTTNLNTIYTNTIKSVEAEIQSILGGLANIGSSGTGTRTPGITSGSTKTGPSATVDTLYLSEEQQKLADPTALVKEAYADALKLQAQIPGEAKRNRLNTVVVFDELQKIFSARGVSEELLRRALDSLTDEMEKANQKADTVRRIRVGAGDFSAIANVPVNSATGVSVGANNQINITFNLNGTNLTPAQFNIFANMIGAEIARRL